MPVGPGGSPTTSPRANAIDLILAAHDPDDAVYLKIAARIQAGYEKFPLRIEEPGKGSGPQGATATAADLVRQSIRRHPQAIVVEAADASDRPLAQAVDEARAAGIVVVLLGRTLAELAATASPETKASPDSGPAKVAADRVAATAAGSPPSRPVIAIVTQPFAESAGRLVATSIRNAKNAKLDPRGAPPADQSHRRRLRRGSGRGGPRRPQGRRHLRHAGDPLRS